ncbi:MAG: rRNA pseudouridine synthase [Salinivirgaceae bacterium]|nr:rRNA pseudouridine synthase [Salinivirgaceae bacterium]
MQFNPANRNEGRRNSRPGFNKKSSDGRFQSKGQNFKQNKQRGFGSDEDDEREERPRRNNRFGDKRNSKPGFRGQSKWHDDDSDSPKQWNSNRKPRFQKQSDDDNQRPRGNYQRRRDYDGDYHGKSAYKEDDSVRLNRYIANAGVCSRRDADQYIAAGVITVNGKIVTELGTKVHYGDEVKFNGAPLMPERKTYILLNKPKDYVTTTEDPHAEKTVMDLIGDSIKNRVYPVGRLDRATTGLLLLTNDGDLAEHLCHPKYNKQKIYQVTLDHKVAPEDIEKMLNGIELEDGMANADEIEYSNPEDPCEVGVVIHSGRNRIVRRMFEALKYKVKKLDRVYYAGLTKKNLPRGKWRFLTDKEVAMLKRGTYK